MKLQNEQEIGLNSTLFIYSSSHLSGSSKVRFFYALKGRDDKLGLIKETNSKFLAKSVILAPANKTELWRSFFKFWGCKFREISLSSAQATHHLFVYDTSNLKSSQLVNFFYAFKGRGKKAGILTKVKGELLAKSVVLVPALTSKELENFFRKFNCRFQKMEVSIQKIRNE